MAVSNLTATVDCRSHWSSVLDLNLTGEFSGSKVPEAALVEISP